MSNFRVLVRFEMEASLTLVRWKQRQGLAIPRAKEEMISSSFSQRYMGPFFMRATTTLPLCMVRRVDSIVCASA
jgi:hypothetical protein